MRLIDSIRIEDGKRELLVIGGYAAVGEHINGLEILSRDLECYLEIEQSLNIDKSLSCKDLSKCASIIIFTGSSIPSTIHGITTEQYIKDLSGYLEIPIFIVSSAICAICNYSLGVTDGLAYKNTREVYSRIFQETILSFVANEAEKFDVSKDLDYITDKVYEDLITWADSIEFMYEKTIRYFCSFLYIFDITKSRRSLLKSILHNFVSRLDRYSINHEMSKSLFAIASNICWSEYIRS